MNPPPLNQSVPANSRAAVSSLVCGICAAILGPFTGIAAIIYGHIALGHIKKSGGSLGGRGMAVAGLVMGYVFSFVTTFVVILAITGFAVGSAAIDKAKHHQALEIATSIEKAVTDFSTEYGSVPSDAATDEIFETDKTSGVGLLKILMAKETEDPSMNLRKLNFLMIREGKKVGTGGTRGIIYNSDDTVVGLYDPWGNGYYVMIDSDGDEDETVNPPLVGNDSASRGVLHKRVAVWSAGADKIVGGKNKADDLKSW